MARKQTTEEERVIHTPAGMHRPPERGDAADGADIASTDMSIDPGGSRADPAPAATREPSERGFVGRVRAVAEALERLAVSEPDPRALRDGVARAGRALREALAERPAG